MNKKASSSGSFIGVLKRTMERAPTNPKDSARDDLTTVITIIVVALTILCYIESKRVASQFDHLREKINDLTNKFNQMDKLNWKNQKVIRCWNVYWEKYTISY